MQRATIIYTHKVILQNSRKHLRDCATALNNPSSLYELTSTFHKLVLHLSKIPQFTVSSFILPSTPEKYVTAILLAFLPDVHTEE